MHFLNPRHAPTSAEGFWCTKSEIAFGATASKTGTNQHERQEREANRFAVELLLPRKRLQQRLSTSPDIEAVLSIANEFDVSKEAAARYYAENHNGCLGVAFSQNDRLRYWSQGPDFLYPRLSRGMQMPMLPQDRGSSLTEVDDGDPLDWFTEPGDATVAVQTLFQQDGHTMTLVAVERDDEEEDGEESAVDRDTPRFRR